MEESLDIVQKITEIEAELTKLDDHRSQLLNELTQLRQQSRIQVSSTQTPLNLQTNTINNLSSQDEKIKLFRSLFKGREDVFPRRFENSRTGKSGYAPVCRNDFSHRPSLQNYSYKSSPL